MMWGYMHGWGWGWGWLMLLGMIGFWGLLIALIVLLVRRSGPPERREPERWREEGRPERWRRRPSPEEVLAERFARGEIDHEEYRQRLQVLRESGQRG